MGKQKIVAPFSEDNFLDGYKPITPDLSPGNGNDQSQDKKDSSGRSRVETDYRNRFLIQPRETYPKKIYLTSHWHDQLELIVKMVGKGDVNLTLSGLLHNILTAHFQEYGGEIDRLLRESFESKRPMGKARK